MPDSDYWDAERVQTLLDVLGWSQSRLARYVGVSRMTVYRWKEGETQPSQMARQKLEKAWNAAQELT